AGGRGRRDPRRQGAARGAAGAAHRSWRRDADPPLNCGRRFAADGGGAMASLGRRLGAAAGGILVCALGASPARADLQLCNRTSYVLDLALGLEDKGTVATRGWFHVDPGQCRVVLTGVVEAERVYLHARALSIYGPTPMPQSGHADLCVADGNFVIAG